MGVLGPANKGESSGRLYVIVYQPLLPLDLHAPCVLGVSDRGSNNWIDSGQFLLTHAEYVRSAYVVLWFSCVFLL